ncbi:hypothetical protein CR513_43808, partial [Mucuna pruriens]
YLFPTTPQPRLRRKKKGRREYHHRLNNKIGNRTSPPNLRSSYRVSYITWLSNVVLIKKNNKKWRMYVNYSDLNKACPKDSYLLSSNDRLVDGALGFQVFSFLDTYSGYNQIKMYPPYMNKMTFMKYGPTYYYKVMSFSLKNAGGHLPTSNGQGFCQSHGCNLKMYMDNMVVESPNPKEHIKDLEEIFAQVRKYDMRLNLDKCVFGNNDYEKAFQDFKQFLASPPILTRLINDQDLYLYLVVSKHSVSAIIVQEEGKSQSPHILHRIPISNDREARPCPHHLGQMVTPLFSFPYRGHPNQPPHPIVKVEALANFLVEMTSTPKEDPWWTMYVDSSSNPKRWRCWSYRHHFEALTQFNFKASNNQAEYEALLVGLDLAREVKARQLHCHTDSQLMGDIPSEGPPTPKVPSLGLDRTPKVQHNHHTNKSRVDTLVRLATTNPPPPPPPSTHHSP